jgi:glycosyltransferase involved in cell wall biosynthesis
VYVDVVVSVFNGARTVESAVSSIQGQTLRDIRIIVVNDGSTDATKTILERLAAADPRIVVINKENGGIVDAANAGLAVCTAEIIARLDADDLATADRLEKQLLYLKENPDCAAVSGAIRHIDEAGRLLGPMLHLPSADLADPTWYPQREPYLPHPFVMMRRAKVEMVGGYRHVLYAEDLDLYWRLQEVGRLSMMPDLLGYYRMHSQSVTSASILNGRISAVNSQLAGISAMRRRARRPDLTFPVSAKREYEEAGSLEKMVAVGSRDLDSDETERLAASASAKLLDLASYRPYDLEAEDCAFIRDAVMRALPQMTEENRQYCTRMLSGAAARLASNGKLAAARSLAPFRLYPSVAGRLALRIAAPPSVRRALRRAIGRYEHAK